MPQYPPGVKNAQKNTWGGWWTASIYSGAANMAAATVLNGAPLAVAAGSDVLLFSGAGRLDSVVPHFHSLHSGQVLGICFYDAGAATSGGPFPASGTKVIFDVPTYMSPLSGGTGMLSSGNVPVVPNLGMGFLGIGQPFQSGLCVACKSGQGGFTVGWTPENPSQ